MRKTFFSVVVVTLVAGACVREQYIPYTRVLDTPVNREIVKTVEAYRLAMERKDAAALLAMASPDYYEDSDTPNAEDDYGYDGLKEVLAKRLAQVNYVRYSLQYMGVHVQQNVAWVDVYIDASYEIHTPQGTKAERQQKAHRMELVYDGKRWLFRRGM